MSLMNTIRSFFASKKNDASLPLDNNPLRLKLGSLVSMDEGFRFLVDGSSEVRPLGARNTVYAKGVIDLGEGFTLHRFYLDDEDLMLQIRTSSYADNFVEEVILFNYLSLITVNERELQRLIGRDSAIGLPTYTREGKTYNRVWGTEDGQTELTLMVENVTNAEESYKVKHMCVLYARETDLADRTEFLLFSAEESAGENGQQFTWQISTTVGLTLFNNDVTVL
jgi:hypothetical protein